MMSVALLTLASPQAAEGVTDAPKSEEIVVVANRPGECRVRLADRDLSERQLDAHAAKWAAEGRSVRVIRPRRADYPCLAEIAFHLGDRGVRLIQFVDSSEQR
jgi:hypothetical protein